ncbi:MAG: GNAT family N-acyltransferase [Pseudomonadota bacterium]
MTTLTATRPPILGKRKLDPNAPVIGRLGSLVVRLARTRTEVRAAQALRYKVFYEEMSAKPSAANRLLRRDKDRYDRYCDHLLVIEQSGTSETIVGTYRLLLPENAAAAGGYYSQSEFDLAKVLKVNSGKRFLELGRSCILPEYRSKRTMELLWHGTWSYALTNKIDILFGCASFEGTDPQAFSGSFAMLQQNSMLPDEEDCTSPLKASVSLHGFAEASFDPRRALFALPPLLKGYLRLGAKVASHAVIDRQFGTTDVLVVLKVAEISPRYLSHFKTDASRFAA